jgi:hypothetical protein
LGNRKEKKMLNNLKSFIPLPYPNNVLTNNCCEIPVKKSNNTLNRKNNAKIQFLIDNYGKMSRIELALSIHETKRWVKRQLSLLFKSGILPITNKKP